MSKLDKFFIAVLGLVIVIEVINMIRDYETSSLTIAVLALFLIVETVRTVRKDAAITSKDKVNRHLIALNKQLVEDINQLTANRSSG